MAVVSSEEMRSITGYEMTRGPLAAFHRPPEPDLAALLTGAHRVAVLEDVTNYTNIGAIDVYKRQAHSQPIWASNPK